MWAELTQIPSCYVDDANLTGARSSARGGTPGPAAVGVCSCALVPR